MLPLLFVGIAKNARAVRILMYCYGAGTIVILLYCYRYGKTMYDRFVLPETSLANGNDLALHLLFGACFMLMFVRRLAVTRILWLAAMPVLAFYVLKTGSRSNMLTLVVLFIVSLVILPGRFRVKPIIGGALMAIAIVPLLPKTPFGGC